MVTFVQSDWPLNIVYSSDRRHIFVLIAKYWTDTYLYKNNSNKDQSKKTSKSS